MGLTACFTWLALGAIAVPVCAGEHGRCCKIEVDIDELDADLYADGDGWLLKVRYEVDVEDACNGEHLTLNLHFSNDDCRVVDADGRVLTHTIPLDQPTECDDDEQTFAGRVELRLDGKTVTDPDDFEVHAAVTRAGGSRVLDRENTSADVHRPRVVVACESRVVEVEREPVVVEVRRRCTEPIVYVRKECRSAVVTVRRPYYVHVGVRW
jgi:hypothetical protein